MRILLAEKPSGKVTFQIPYWAYVPDDEFGTQQALLGYVYCKACNKIQSHENKACMLCCKHEVLRFTTERLGNRTLEMYIEMLAVVCEKCGKIYAKDEWEELYGRKIVNE